MTAASVTSTANMTEPARRVALLARPGVACERLQAALREAGAEVVLVADPDDSDVARVRAAGPQAILVALDPSMEDALAAFDALLTDSALTVIFDEAELAAKREGWDAARWSRHLVAKLNRHDSVLPAGTEDIPTESLLQPGAVTVYQRPESDGDLAVFASEAADNWLEIPRDDGGAAGPGAAPSMFDPVLAEMDATPGELTFDPVFAGLEMSLLEVETASDTAPPGLSLADVNSDSGTTRLVPAAAGVADTHDAVAALQVPDGSNVTDRFHRDLSDLQSRIAGMQLEDARPARTASPDGAVLILAGIGGPDAVRQLLGGLSAGFPRPVIIQQRLEGARHDKLVRQMQRATPMTVHLAESGAALQRGCVYILTEELGIAMQDDGLHFVADPGDLIVNLPAADSAVIVLSGTDPAVVDAAMANAFRGSLVAGQSPDGCFDAAAAQALVARGAEAGAPVQLAKMLAARWPA